MATAVWCLVWLMLMSHVFKGAVAYGPGTSNMCTLHHGGCEYKLVMTGKDCSAHHDITRKRLRTSAGVEDENGEEGEGEGGGQDDTDVAWQNYIIENDIPIKRIDALETRLLKMMEGISVRSLRHIRQIRSDLRDVSQSLNSLKDNASPSSRVSRGTGCPPEFITVGTWPSCYRFSTFNASWHEAREYCSAIGTNLVAMETIKETYIIDYLIKSDTDVKVPRNWWTSGSYAVRQRQWMWTTRHHIKPIEYNRWATGRPLSPATPHTCLLMFRSDRYWWHDVPCADKHSFICEVDLAN